MLQIIFEGAMKGIESVGARIKSSRSLQNLETATADSLRCMKERTSDIGENVRRKYGSQINVAMGKYESLDADEDFDTLRWRH